MMKRRCCLMLTVVLLAFFVTALAQAHVPYLEPEVLRRWGECSEAEDYSFENPFIVESGRIFHSKAIFAYLHRGDVDVYKYTASPGEKNMILAGALPPACKCYSNFYPATALIGPGLPPPDPDDKLPFDIPEDCENCGVLVKWPIRVPLNQRPVFKIPEADYSWFFPTDFAAESIMEVPSEPGDYYIVMWNPTGLPGDYTASIGIEEVITAEDRIRIDTVRPLFNNYITNHLPCKQATGPAPF